MNNIQAAIPVFECEHKMTSDIQTLKYKQHKSLHLLCHKVPLQLI
jgi:hypothetical protein